MILLYIHFDRDGRQPREGEVKASVTTRKLSPWHQVSKTNEQAANPSGFC